MNSPFKIESATTTTTANALMAVSTNTYIIK